jgi:hypothetical protein
MEIMSMLSMNDIDLQSPREIIRAMMQVQLDLTDYEMTERLFPQSSITPVSELHLPASLHASDHQSSIYALSASLPPTRMEQLQHMENSLYPEQHSPQSSTYGTMTSVSSFEEGEETETSSATLPPGSNYTDPSRDHLEALFEYESTLSLLFGATVDGICTGRDSSAGEFRPTGPYGNAMIWTPYVETDIHDPAACSVLMHDLMASFSRLHTAHVSPMMRGAISRDAFQNIIWRMWQVVEMGDRDALRSLDNVLRGSSFRHVRRCTGCEMGLECHV